MKNAKAEPQCKLHFGQQWGINIGSSMITKVSLSLGMLTMGAGGRWDIFVPSSIFVINLKLLLKIKSLKKPN
jgi:hypothetical protein